MEYKTSVHASTGQTPEMLEKGWNTRLPADTLRKVLIKIYPTDSSFKMILDKVKHHAKQIMDDTFYYEKQKWDNIHKLPDLKCGDLVLLSILNYNSIKGPKKLKDSYVGPLLILPYMELIQFK
ncbi:hypothetical protein O181_051409 [Austropuccinia psidii MF-1]|uniref:Uncharacterized protein n=1 Tax=Austropuccinia psidii MF-1 TaxID=1389203 RepID=A0A9Q3DYR8_9BASI|nr:hypothetical protein [Austropuccinia psidii MF-1]